MTVCNKNELENNVSDFATLYYIVFANSFIADGNNNTNINNNNNSNNNNNTDCKYCMRVLLLQELYVAPLQGFYWSVSGQLRLPIHIFVIQDDMKANRPERVLVSVEYTSIYNTSEGEVFAHWRVSINLKKLSYHPYRNLHLCAHFTHLYSVL